MADREGEGPDFDELKMPNDEATPEELPPMEPLANFDFDEFAVSEVGLPSPLEPQLSSEVELPLADEGAAEADAEPMQPEDKPTEETEEKTSQEKGPKEESAQGPSKLPVYLEWGSIVGVPVLVVALALIHVVCFSTAIYVIAVGLVGYGLWRGRATSTIYTVFMALTLVAILTSIYCLSSVVVDRYHGDIKAREFKQR